MFSRLKTAIVAGVLIFSIGLHWPLLQSFAWLNMIVSYSKTDGLEQAVVKTFSGKHPCKLCILVAEGKKAETKKPGVDLLKKNLDLFTLSGPFLFIQTHRSVTYPDWCAAPELRTHRPASPPPDFA